MSNLVLTCRACGHTITLDHTAQTKILAELRLPSQRKILDCQCGAYQFVLGGALIRPREPKSEPTPAVN